MFTGCRGFCSLGTGGFLGNIGSGCVLLGVGGGCGSELEVVSENGEGEEEEAGCGGYEDGEDVGEEGRWRDEM